MHPAPVIAFGLAAGLFLSACGPQAAQAPSPSSTPPPPAAVTVSAAPVRRGDIQQSLAYSGEIRAREQISILPKATGRIERLLVDTGSQVKAGDTIAVLEHDSAQVSALQARATLAGAQAKLATLQGGPRAEDVTAAEATLS